jgi:hypothetical protein
LDLLQWASIDRLEEGPKLFFGEACRLLPTCRGLAALASEVLLSEYMLGRGRRCLLQACSHLQAFHLQGGGVVGGTGLLHV